MFIAELANSNRPEQEDTSPSCDNPCNSNNPQCVNDNEDTDENRNSAGRGQ